MARGVVVVSRMKGWNDAGYQLSPDELKALNKQSDEVRAAVGAKQVGRCCRHAPGGRRHAMYWDREFEVWYEREAGA